MTGTGVVMPIYSGKVKSSHNAQVGFYMMTSILATG